MKWHAVIQAAVDLLRTDPYLVPIFGDKMWYDGSQPHTHPLLTWRLVADGQNELWAPTTIQFDVWCDTMEDLVLACQVLDGLFHIETQRVIGGMPMWGQYVDGETTASPDPDGYFGRAVRYSLTPLRARYEPVP